MLKSTAREATLSGRCFSVTDEESMDSRAAMRTLREKFVKYNTKKSMYRDGDVLAVYELEVGHQSLAGCADACLLDWRTSGNQTIGTDVEGDDATDDPWGSVNITTPFRECEAFNFNINNGKCTILSGQSYLQLTSSDNYWSGKLVCDDLDTTDPIQDLAEQIVA
eukprot:jgi/Picre1/35021/NNA_002486.t1